jgi:hypothetical protein
VLFRCAYGIALRVSEDGLAVFSDDINRGREVAGANALGQERRYFGLWLDRNIPMLAQLLGSSQSPRKSLGLHRAFQLDDSED